MKTNSMLGPSVGGWKICCGKWAAAVVTLLIVALPLDWTGPAYAAAFPSAHAETQPVIVVLREGTDPTALVRGQGITPSYVYSSVFAGFAAEPPAATLDLLRADPRVILVSPDRPVHVAGQRVPTGVDRIDAEPRSRKSSRAVDIDVAVLDTGVPHHPDLNVAGGKACVGDDAADKNGHATHVAGTIAAKDDGRGVVGVAPGARIWGVKVLGNDGSSAFSKVICGLDWVYRHQDRIDIVNMSLGGFGDDGACAEDALHLAVCNVVQEAGIPVVVAAGNFGSDTNNFAPATYAEAIAVSAFADLDGKPSGLAGSGCGDRDDTFADTSNFGQDVDIAAPGVCIRSTWLDGKYRTLTGTSFSTPHVTGAAARYLARQPNATPDDVRRWLLADASRPQHSDVGFTGDPDGVPEPALYLGTRP